EPYYPFYPQQVRAAGGVPVCVPMAGSSNFSLNVAAVRAKLTPKTKAIILNSPNNPTGSCYSKQELQELAQLVLAYNLVVISDEVYTNFCYENEHVSFAAITGMRQHTITIGSFSKNYVMTGWRVGFIFTSPDLVYIMKEINENNVFTSPTVSQRASIHALAARKRIQQYLYTEFKTRLFYLYQELSLVKGFKPIKPQGAIYLFIDVSATQKTGIEIAEFLFAQANVAVIPGCSYGESTGNYIRITASKKIEELQLAVARIKAAIGQL
ncbi:MAG: pyridoxal phosphate-dependent aminotransferase, partial [Burkholderiales bacterium]